MSTPPIPPAPESQPGFEQIIVPPASSQPAAGYPPAPSQVYSQPGQPGYPPPSAPKSGNTVLKVVLIIVAVFVLFGVVVAGVLGYGAYKLSRAVHRAASGDVSFSTPGGGSISAGSSASITSSDLGIPEYPGAHQSNGGMRMKTSSGSLVTAVFTTSDSPDKVADFYKEKMGEQASVMEGSGSTILTSGETGEDKIVVTITPDSDGTKITVMHTSHLH